ncbi:MAG: small multi-drug export protein, partial [Candidatus Hydrogenedentes bacterium]|nr:small multi-drug export protein [Candidatus Hydrogenedentota bacterium]
MDNAGKNRVPAYAQCLLRITLAGQWLLTLTVVLFATMGVLWPEPYAKVWQLILAHIVGGRPANVLIGINLGFPLPFIYLQCVLEDLIIMFLFYPLLVFGYRRAFEWRVLGSALVSIRQAAHRHKSKVEPYGVAGLMFFVIFPFWSTGALAAAFVGYLIGMRTSVTFVAVTVGNLIAVACWVWLFNEINQFSSQLAQGMLVAVFGAVIVGA